MSKADVPERNYQEAPAKVAGLESPRAGSYLPVWQKFIIATGFAVLWFSVSVWLADPWVQELSAVVGFYPAWIVILLVALIPGFTNAHILASLLMDSPPPLPENIKLPPVTILIAAHNEEKTLPGTFEAIAKQNYPADLEIIVVNDGSTDGTSAWLQAQDMPDLKVLHTDHVGKAGALNEGLRQVANDITVCIDADTFLHPTALRRIVTRLVSDPPHTAAVAGAVMVRNSRETFWTRVQEWDYFIGIASVKRQQSLYQGTLVAQGAFSAFRTDALRLANGWPPVIGEDIVMTWSLLKRGWRVGFEATAIAFTTAPDNFSSFWRQRQRWARGMIEGLKTHGNLVWNGRLSGFFVGMDFVIPAVDLAYSFAFLPGVILALTGNYFIVGPMTLFVLPLALVIVLSLLWQQKKVFDQVGLKIRRNHWGFLMFVLVFQAVMSPVSVTGYFKEALGFRKRW